MPGRRWPFAASADFPSASPSKRLMALTASDPSSGRVAIQERVTSFRAVQQFPEGHGQAASASLSNRVEDFRLAQFSEDRRRRFLWCAPLAGTFLD